MLTVKTFPSALLAATPSPKHFVNPEEWTCSETV